MDQLERIWQSLDRGRLEELLSDAVACYSPSFAEDPVIELFDEALDSRGLPHRRQEVEGPASEDRANLIIELGSAPLGMLWLGHLDTVPLLTDEELGARRDGDLLFGLGTADMKSGCVAIVEALAAVKASGVPLTRGVAAALVVGEEEYGDGTEALSPALSAPLTVVGEPTALAPCLAHFGHFELKLSAVGARAHAALPEVGANAILGMLDWVKEILARLPRLPDGDSLALNLREIRGGESRFVVAERCEALLDVHCPPGVTADRFEAVVEQLRREVQQQHQALQLEWERAFWADGYSLDPAASEILPLVQAFQRLGRPFEPSAFRSHSDAAILAQRGLAPVICGPGRLEAAHTPEEHVSLDEVWEAARLYAALIHAACVREAE